MSLVLVADDEPAVLEVLSEVVEDLGHEVVRAHDGKEALLIARAQQPALVVTDHMMPRLSGVDLCKQIRQDDTLKNVPIILLSAALPQGVPEAQAFLPKPFELTEFEKVVRETLAGQDAHQAPREPELKLDDSPEMISWVTHELKTPLAAAKLNMELLRRGLAREIREPEERHIQAVQRQLLHMELLVNSLLDAAQIADGKMLLQLARTDLRRLVEEVVVEWRERRPDFTFELRLPEQRVELKVDDGRIRQVLNNLISNATKYGFPPSRVAVELTVTSALATVRVIDSGPGIAAAEQLHLFDRFRRASRGGRGHGLGLFIAASIARLHGGSLTVKSSIGAGATFSLGLPAAG